MNTSEAVAHLKQRKRAVRNLHVITCADCGAKVIRLPPAVFCLNCVRRRYLASEKRRRVRNVTRDPDFYKKQNAWKNAWKHRQRMAKGPMHCVVCGVEMARIQGRRESVAMCAYDRLLNRRFLHNWRRRQLRIALPPHRCIGCGAPVARIRGLRAEIARCPDCKRAHKNRLHREWQRARKQISEVSNVA